VKLQLLLLASTDSVGQEQEMTLAELLGSALIPGKLKRAGYLLGLPGVQGNVYRDEGPLAVCFFFVRINPDCKVSHVASC